MTKVKISVVITVYNMEAYLEECILSVINQTFKNIEILIVNDGSIDNSSLIIEKYKNIDSRIRVFTTNNQGSSSAKNVGIDNLKGDYIVFVDGDDYCMPSMIIQDHAATVHNKRPIIVYILLSFVFSQQIVGEILITILSSLAQEESRNISENTRWGVVRRFENGKMIVNHNKFMGYTKNENGDLVIVPEEAEIVRLIFRLYLEGYSAKKIS